MSEYFDLLVRQGALHTIGVVSKAVVIDCQLVRYIFIVGILRYKGPSTSGKVFSLKCL